MRITTIIILILLFFLVNYPVSGGEMSMEHSVKSCEIRAQELQSYVDNARQGLIKATEDDIKRLESRARYWQERCDNLKEIYAREVAETRLKKAREKVDELRIWQSSVEAEIELKEASDAVEVLNQKEEFVGPPAPEQ